MLKHDYPNLVRLHLQYDFELCRSCIACCLLQLKATGLLAEVWHAGRKRKQGSTTDVKRTRGIANLWLDFDGCGMLCINLMCPCPCSFMLLFNFIISFCLFALYVILSVALEPLKRALPAIHLSIIILFQVITNSITPSASAQQITQKRRLCKPRYKYSFYVGRKLPSFWR